jgi:hypothetical protein
LCNLLAESLGQKFCERLFGHTSRESFLIVDEVLRDALNGFDMLCRKQSLFLDVLRHRSWALLRRCAPQAFDVLQSRQRTRFHEDDAYQSVASIGFPLHCGSVMTFALAITGEKRLQIAIAFIVPVLEALNREYGLV